MRFRKRYLPIAALVGAVLGVVPALATSGTTPTISATSSSCSTYTYCWSPSQVTLMPSGEVTFDNATAGVPHGILWTGSLKPSCAASVPDGEGGKATSSSSSWSGNCAFAQAGTYTFQCSVHPYMTGSVVVGSGTTSTTGTTGTTTTTTTTTTTPPPTATSTTTTTPPPTTTTSTTPPPSTTGTSTSPPPASTSSNEETSAPSGSLLIQGSLKLAVPHHASAVHGSLDVSQAGAGGRLEVDLIAKSALLARRGRRAKSVIFGRLVRTSVSAGRVSFAVALNARGKSVLRRHHRLPLTVKIVLTPPMGKAAQLTRGVVLRA